MKAKVAEKPQKKAVALEDDARIVAGTLKGEAELRAGLGKRFKDADGSEVGEKAIKIFAHRQLPEYYA